jgi:hypothetical protein
MTRAEERRQAADKYVDNFGCKKKDTPVLKTFIIIALYIFLALFIILLLYSVAGIVYSLSERDYISAAFYGVRAIEHLTSLTLAACAYFVGQNKK